MRAFILPFSAYVTWVLERSHEKTDIRYFKGKHLYQCESYNLLNDENLDQNTPLSDQHPQLTDKKKKTQNNIFIRGIQRITTKSELRAESPDTKLFYSIIRMTFLLSSEHILVIS